MHARRYLLLALIPSLAGCHHDQKDISTFDRRLQCANLATTDKWNDPPDGPFLDNTFYSPANDTCVFVLKKTHRGEKDGGIHNEVLIVDALTRKQLWANDPEAGQTPDQLTAGLNDELKKLQIIP